MKKHQSRYGALKVAFATTVILFITVLATGFSFAQGTSPGDGRGDSGTQVQVTNTSDHPVPVYFATKTKSSSSKAPAKTVVVKDTVTVVNNYFSQPDPSAPLKVDAFRLDYINGTVVGTGIVDMRGIPIGQIGQVPKEQPANASWLEQARQQVAPANNWWSDNWPWVLLAAIAFFLIIWYSSQRENRAREGREEERMRQIDERSRNFHNEINNIMGNSGSRTTFNPQSGGNFQGNLYQVPVNLQFEVVNRGVTPHNCPPPVQ